MVKNEKAKENAPFNQDTQERGRSKQALWSGLAGLVFCMSAFIFLLIVFQTFQIDRAGGGLKPLYYAAPIAAFLTGTFLWWLLVSKVKTITLRRGFLVGALIALVSHSVAWYLLTFYLVAANALGVSKLTFPKMLGLALINTFTSIVSVGWITVPGGGLIGIILTYLQGRGLKEGIGRKKIVRNKKQALIFLIVIIVFSRACIDSDGPYRGRVVELETGKPIEGAIVAAEWSRTVIPFFMPAFDFKETLTDKDGEFVLPKNWGFTYLFAKIDRLTVVVFKPSYLGYPPFGYNLIEIKERMPDFTGHEFRDEKQYYIIKLGKAKTREERKRTLDEAIDHFLDEEKAVRKLPVLLKLTNEESRSLGLPERPFK
jgi:hypothetical protein